jgi:D-alanyl-D-alanine carboxypeptidase/D-alanyl-D-alanine-endopeptidase (penicillin-binding protein 4)
VWRIVEPPAAPVWEPYRPPAPERSRWWWLLVVAGVVAALVLAGGAFVGGYAGTREVRRQIATPTPTPSTPAALANATNEPAPATTTPGSTPADSAAVTKALRSLLRDPALGGRVFGEVVDTATGAVLYSGRETTPVAPASTAKLLTAAAVLLTRGGGYRIATTVVTDGSGTVALVGAGDPTLTGAAPGKDGAYDGAARLSDLAAQVKKAGVPVTRIVVDDSLFTGLPASPAWAQTDIPSDYAAPVTAVMADGGRDTPSSVIRSLTPDLAAGTRLAALLGKPDAPVARGTAPVGARTVGTVQSAQISTLVAQMLQLSDNVIAECLARQVALATHADPSFSGAAAAVRSVLAGTGLDPGAGMVDASGLAESDRVTPATLTALLRLATGTEHPELHTLVAGLPVAGWTGTLADRYLSGSSAKAAGLVRAKTGTLSRVSSLAGLVHDTDGRLLAFAFVADRVPATADAEAALDRIAAALSACGCR